MRLAALLAAALCPLLLGQGAALAAGDTVTFGEVRDGKIAPTRLIKMCGPKTGYRYGFEIALPAGSHNVRGDMQWPAPPGNPNVGVSSRHMMDDYGDHSGRYLKTFTHDEDDLAGAWKLTVFVDRQPVATLDFTLVKAAHCP